MQHVVCTNCDTVNRFEADKDPVAARCGKCDAPLFSGEPADLAAASLERQIARSDIPVVVDVWAPWCGPCRVMGPEFKKVADVLEPAVRFVKLNSDENQALAGRLGIRGIPTMIVFRGGKELARTSGAMSSGAIVKWLDDAMSGA
jgi:thioredoxin 2